MLKRYVILMVFLVFSTATALAVPGAGDTVEVDFAAGREATSIRPQVMEVVATGVGIDPENALQNAFSHAIEHAVGVLVDAETRIENDEIVSDKVLTFSRGFVQKYTVTKQWEKGGLHYARIRARVAISKLAERLKAQNIAVREVPGELLYRQLKHELITEENAAEMFRRAMEDYNPEKFLIVQILGQPEVVERDETHARLRVNTILSVDRKQWVDFRNALFPLLKRIAGKYAAHNSTRYGPSVSANGMHSFGYRMANEKRVRERLKGEGCLMHLFKGMNRSGSVTQWDSFRVPWSLESVLDDLRERNFRLRIVLLDRGDRPLVDVDHKMIIGAHHRACYPYKFRDEYFVSPLMWDIGVNIYYCTVMPYALEVDIDLEKLSRIDKCVAYIEEVKR